MTSYEIYTQLVAEGFAKLNVQYLNELTADKTNEGVKPLPDVDPVEVAAMKEAAEAEAAKLEAEIAAEVDAKVISEKEQAKLYEAAKIAEAEYLIRLKGGKLTAEDQERIEREQKAHEAEMADKRAALIKRGLIVDKADAADAKKLQRQAEELAKLNAILGTDIKIADVVAVAEEAKG
jgi:hypothetical protein